MRACVGTWVHAYVRVCVRVCVDGFGYLEPVVVCLGVEYRYRQLDRCRYTRRSDEPPTVRIVVVVARACGPIAYSL